MNFHSSVILDLARVLLSLVHFSLRISRSFEPCCLDTNIHVGTKKLGCWYLVFFLVAARLADKTAAPLLLIILVRGRQPRFSFPNNLWEYFSHEENKKG